jgi:hypothetical protein
MRVFAAMREGESRGIGEPRRRAVNDFRDQRERLQRSWSEVLHEQQRRKVAQLSLVGHREHRAQPLQIDVFGAHVVMHRQPHLHHFGQRTLRAVARDGEQRILGRLRPFVDEVLDDRSLPAEAFGEGGLTNNRRVRLARKVSNGCGMPVIAARQSRLLVHPLLDDRPLAVPGQEEAVQINLESVGDGVVIHLGGEPAGSHERVTIETRSLGDRSQFVRCVARVASAATANVDAQLVRARIETALQGAEH